MDLPIYPLEIDEPANVNWAKFLQNEGTHHMTLSTPALDGNHGWPMETTTASSSMQPCFPIN